VGTLGGEGGLIGPEGEEGRLLEGSKWGVVDVDSTIPPDEDQVHMDVLHGGRRRKMRGKGNKKFITRKYGLIMMSVWSSLCFLFLEILFGNT